MSFADVSAPRRTDIDFAAGVYDDHCREKSPLLLISGTKLVTQFLLDYLHLICLGTVQKMLYLWTKGLLNVQLSGVLVKIFLINSLNYRNISRLILLKNQEHYLSFVIRRAQNLNCLFYILAH